MKELISPFIPVLKFKAEVYEVSEGLVLETKDFLIEAAPLEHGAPCNGYLFKEKDKLRIDKNKLKKLKINRADGKKIKDLTQGRDIIIDGNKIRAKDYTYKQEGKKIAFILDTKLCANAKKLAKDADLAIIESTYSENEEELARDHLHLTAKQAAEIAKFSKAKELILTHISQRFENKEKILLDEAKLVFKNVKISYDFMKVEV